MLRSHRASYGSLPGVKPARQGSFETLKGSHEAEKGTTKLDIILVHGSCISRGHKVEKTLRKNAANIEMCLELCRVHVFNFDAAKLLRKGKRELDTLTRTLLDHVKKIPDRKRLALIGHNVAVWVVRAALVQSQYDQDLLQVPVGLVDFALPDHPSHIRWHTESNWIDFREDLLQRLTGASVKRGKNGSPSENQQINRGAEPDKVSLQEHMPLDFSTIRQIYQEFKDFRMRLKAPDTSFPIFTVACPERKPIPPGVSRKLSDSSQESGSSTSSVEDLPHMFVSMNVGEVEEVVEFMKKVSQTSPASIPILSTSSPTVRRIAELSRIWRSGSYNRTSEALQTFRTTDHNLKTDEIAPRIPAEVPKPDRVIVKVDDQLKDIKATASWYMQNGDLGEADRLYHTLITWYKEKNIIDRSYWKMHLQIGQICFVRGQYRDADTKLRTLLGSQYERLRNLPSKEHEREATLTSEIARWLALSQLRQGSYTDARKTLEICMEKLKPLEYMIDPNLNSIFALVLASIGSFKRAWDLSSKITKLKYFEKFYSTSNGGTSAIPAHRSSCLVNHARICSVVGKFDLAHDSNLEALQEMKERLGSKHFITLDACSLQARLLVARSRTSQAAEAVYQTLDEMTEQLGASHPSTLQTLESLVLIYMSDGRYSEAKETGAYLLRKNEEVLGPSHPQTLKSKSISAEILLSCAEFESAERYQREVVEVEEENLSNTGTVSTNNPSIFTYKTTLAHILLARGKWNEARTLSFRVLVEQLNQFSADEDDTQNKTGELESLENSAVDIRDSPRLRPSDYINHAKLRKLLKESQSIRTDLDMLPRGWHSPLANSQPVKIYPSIVQTLHCFALCEQARDDADLRLARGILGMVFDMRADKLGKEHRLTVNVLCDIAVNYRLQGKLNKALSKIREVIKMRKESLGTEHPDYSSAKHEECVILLRLGQWKEAFREQDGTLKAQERLLGRSHPDTVLSRFTLGGIYHSLHQLEEADKCLVQVVYDQTQIYGEDHPIVLRSRARRAMILLDMATPESLESAKEEQAIVVEQRKKKLPRGHRLIRSALNDLAQIIQASGGKSNLEEALEIYETLVRSPYTETESKLDFGVHSNIGSCYFELGNFEKAEEYQARIYEESSEPVSRSEDKERLIASTFNYALTIKHSLGRNSETLNNRFERACRLLEDAVEDAEGFFGKDHPQTVELRTTLLDWDKERMSLQDSRDSI